MLFVKDLGRMTAFYADVLGLTPNEETRLDNWVEFTDEASHFSLHAIPAAYAAGIQIESPPRPREQTAAKLTFEVQDVEATLKRIEVDGAAAASSSVGRHRGRRSRRQRVRALCSQLSLCRAAARYRASASTTL